jgi:hypothetical protein
VDQCRHQALDRGRTSRVPSNGKCSNCGGVGEERVRYQSGQTKVLVTGILPMASVLFFLPAGTTLEILHKACGDPSRYDERDMILRFLGCQVTERRMANVITLDARDQDWLQIEARIECVAQLVLDVEDPWRETMERWLTR